MTAVRAKFTASRHCLSRLAVAFRDDEGGASAIEYTLIAGLIFLAIVAAVNSYANTTSDVYGEIDSSLTDAIE